MHFTGYRLAGWRIESQVIGAKRYRFQPRTRSFPVEALKQSPHETSPTWPTIAQAEHMQVDVQGQSLLRVNEDG